MSTRPLPSREAEPRLDSYSAARAAYAPSVPARFNPVLDIVERWAAEDPLALALVSIGERGELVAEQSVGDLATRSRQMARALVELGVEKGDAVLIMLPRVPAWYTAMLGAIRIGAVPVPTPNLSTSRDLAYRLGAARAKVVITDDAGVEKVASITDELPELRVRIRANDEREAAAPGWHDLNRRLELAGDGPVPDDPTAREDSLIIFFTSGTVSYPKMVRHDQSYGLGHVGTARFWHDLRPGDRHWTISDTGWAKAAWGGLFGQWHERATVVQVALGRPDADTILSIVSQHDITSFCAPPTLYRLLVQADLRSYDLSRLRHCTSAGEPLNAEVIRAWRAGTGLTVYDGYGQSETTVLVANYRTVDVRPGSMGKPVPGYEIAIVDDDGNRLPPDEVGNIVVATEPRPTGLFVEYLGDADATQTAFRGGWYFTGDKASHDADGYFWFESRSDDVITSSAYRIGPFEVESALIEHPAVMEAAVVGKDDLERTQIVCAFVILAAGFEPSETLATELQDHVKQVTAPYKYPREIRFVAELPKTISGKIRRSELRRRLRAEAEA